MHIFDRIPTKTLAILALLSVFIAATVISPYLPHTVLHAQQVGPGGVPGAGGGGGAVSSVFGRTGAIVAANGDYTAAQVTNTAATNAANTFAAGPQIIQTGNALEFGAPNGTPVLAESVPANLLQIEFSSLFGYDYAAFNGDGLADSAIAGVAVPANACFSYTASNSTATSATLTALCQPTADTVNFGAFSAGISDGTAWLQFSAMGSGVSGNTDLRGHLTLSSGTATYTFAKAYMVAPTCTASDTTTAAAVKSSASTTVLTITGTGTDVVNYICAD